MEPTRIFIPEKVTVRGSSIKASSHAWLLSKGELTSLIELNNKRHTIPNGSYLPSPIPAPDADTLKSLDPYSQFLDPDGYKEIRAETEGKFGGIGIEISFRDGVLTIISPVDDTPADRAGLQPNDKIVRIDGKSTRDLDLNNAVKTLRGKPGSEVVLTILREGEGRLVDAKIKRDIIKVKSIKDVSMIDGNVG